MYKFLGLLLAGAFILVPCLKGIPVAIEYYSIKTGVATILTECTSEVTKTELKNRFSKYAEVNSIRDITAEDLTLELDGASCSASYEYERVIHLAGPVSLVFTFDKTIQRVKKR